MQTIYAIILQHAPTPKQVCSQPHDMYSTQFSSQHILTVFLCFTLHWSLLLSSHAPSPSTLARAREYLPPLAVPGGTRRRHPFSDTRLISTESELDRKIETLTQKILLITNLSSFTSDVIRQKWNMFDDKSPSQRVCHRHLNDFANVKIEIALNHVEC